MKIYLQRSGFMIGFLVLCLGGCFGFSARAATYTVTTTADSGAGSLRQAVLDADGTTVADTIVFYILSSDTGCNLTNSVCKITLASEIAVTNSLTISGTGANRLTIDGGAGTNRIFFMSMMNASYSLSGMTLTGGNGGGSNPGSGGAIWTGNVNTTFNSVYFTSNSANSSSTNAGGAVYHSGGNHRYENCAFSGNTSGANGGAVYLTYFAPSGSLTIVNSTLTGNSSANYGGAVAAVGSSVSLTLQNNTVSGNQAPFGGGILFSGGGTFAMANNIIAGNIAPASRPEIFVQTGAATSNGYNLIGDSAGDAQNTNIAITYQSTDILNTPPQIAPLGIYGGATPTRALLSGSPAINAGTSTDAPAADQRGAARVGQPDIGAFELNNSANSGSYRAALPKGTPNSNYNFIITPNNGSFTYTLTGGSLPGGVNLTTSFAPNAVVALSGTPMQTGTFNFSITASDGANSVITDYTLPILVPTAASVTVSGKVTAGGRALSKARVYLTNSNGETRTALTNGFGYYIFDDVSVGETYIFNVVSKGYTFNPQVITVFEDMSAIDFISVP